MTWPISDARIAAKAPGSHDLFLDLRDKLAQVAADASSLVNLANVPPLPNGSFEQDAPGTVNPVGWAFTGYTGGSALVTNADSSHGAQCYVANHPGGAGNGGGTLGLVDKLAVGQSQAFEIYFDSKASAVGVHCSLYARWYDKDGIQIGADVLIWDQNGTYPTSWRTFTAAVTPIMTPSAAKFMDLYFQLGKTDLDPGVSTDISVDGISLVPRRLFTRAVGYGTTTTFTVPAGVHIVKVYVVGAGGWPTSSLLMGGGGAYCEGYASVYPGQVVTVTVGVAAAGTDGTASSFLGLSAGGGTQIGGGGYAAGGYLNLWGHAAGMPSNNHGGMCGAGLFAGYGWGKSNNNSAGSGLVLVLY